jgi:hypothetical protein
MVNIKIASLSDEDLLLLKASVEEEVQKRRSSLLLPYIKNYIETKADKSGMVDYDKMYQALMDAFLITKEGVKEAIEDLKKRQLLWLSIVPGREITMVKVFFERGH